MTLQFQYPWVLFLLWLVPLAAVLWGFIARRRRAGAALVSPVMGLRLAPAPAPLRTGWQAALFLTGCALALIAAARPQWGQREETVYQRGRDLMIVLDVSRSMLARDVHPSRLGRAKVDLLDLVRQLRGDRVGLLAFRGRPVLLCPLTTDYGFLAQVLEGAGVDSAPAGETDIGNAIVEAIQNLQGDEGSHKAIVLISDGEDLAGKTDAAIAKAKEAGVAIFTVGFGGTEGTPVPSPDNKGALMYQGKEVMSQLNHQVMHALADATGGAYVPVGVANVKLGDLYRDHLSRIRARELEESVERRYIERFQLFLFPALCCFLAAAFLSRGQVALRRPVPRPAAGALIAAVCVLLHGLCPLPASATTTATNVPPGREGARLAQRLYLQGKYEEAGAAYQAAARTAARATRDAYLYNAGCAYLKAGQYEEAADAFRGLTDAEGKRGTEAAYNLGCALFAQGTSPADKESQPDPARLERQVQALRQAGATFQKALRQDSEAADSRRNLSVVAGMMSEAEETAKIARLMAEHGQTPPGALADTLLLRQRELATKIPHAFTNTTATLIPALETLATEQDQAADLMIPLKGKLLQAMSQAQTGGNATNMQQQMAQLNQFAEHIRDQLYGVSGALRDLDPSAQVSAVGAEEAIYTLWKGLAGYSQLLREDIQRQSNAITRTVAVRSSPETQERQSIRHQQAEAAQLTDLFQQRFAQEVPPEGLTQPVQQADTNAPAATNATETILSPEDRRKILDLAAKAVSLQTGAASRVDANLTASLPLQREAHGVLKEIERLLPKQKSPQQQQQQDQQQQQQDQQQQPQEQPEEQKQPREQPKPKEEKKDQMSPEELKRLLDKARQREKDHEQERRQRETRIPMSPLERDW